MSHDIPSGRGADGANVPLRVSTLEVPGARLYYEVRGTGPLLLMIPGGALDAGVFAALAEYLADRYTVVTYDPRGNSRSVLDGEPEDQRVDVHADDAARLIEALGGGATYVFGNSGGAQIGLALAARHPERVAVVVAHEPPCVMLLPDPEDALAADREVYDTFRRAGAGPATEKFLSMHGLDDGPPPDSLPPDVAETFARVEQNMPYFLGHGLIPLSVYRPDVECLRSGRPRVVVGVGEASAGQTIYRIGVALAEALGSEAVHFPGDHAGYGSDPVDFGKTLHRVLRAE